ncbi:TetR/AcrR family transcriptional regulator [Saccharothrix violaceirubra]|uniref:AcrR family transcriptional regulator n=1 Tax=Saccharothrix violaceirubra TaxID=413306 RepID=A0A7W7T620_9PSEU|nr:TetR/AcrR family transcriptional regulator [Saccharothrix violaceirubra]MBB4966642.1 AcrR family transcriptional regulator [Saccharothrix violaceirubra]
MTNVAERMGERERRTLRVCAHLLSDWGYKRVTVEAIASRAGIGKGTVYLHWKTKDELFGAVLVQQSVEVIRELGEVVRANPYEVRLHRMVGHYLTAVARRPLVRAMFVRDQEVLGRLAHSGPPAVAALRQATNTLFLRYFDAVVRLGLVVPGCDPVAVRRTVGMLTCGALMQRDEKVPECVRVAADLARRAFEPRAGMSSNSITTAAALVVDLVDGFVPANSPALTGERG